MIAHRPANGETTPTEMLDLINAVNHYCQCSIDHPYLLCPMHEYVRKDSAIRNLTFARRLAPIYLKEEFNLA